MPPPPEPAKSFERERNATDRLFDAVEQGKPDLVKKALMEGGNPEERKKVTLVARWKTGEILVEKAGIFSSEKYEDTFETKSEVKLGENVLSLAIRGGNLEIIRALLESGRCDPNKKVSWRIAAFFRTWTEINWEKNRWFEWNSTRFPSALDFALESGKTAFSKPGSDVVITNPSSWDDVREDFMLTPRLEVVKLVVKHGAHVTESVMEIARRLKDGRDGFGEKMAPRPEFFEFLAPLSPAVGAALTDSMGPGSVSPLPSAGVVDPSRLAEALAEQVRINGQQRQEIERLRSELAEWRRRYDDVVAQTGYTSPDPTPASVASPPTYGATYGAPAPPRRGDTGVPNLEISSSPASIVASPPARSSASHVPPPGIPSMMVTHPTLPGHGGGPEVVVVPTGVPKRSSSNNVLEGQYVGILSNATPRS